MLFSLNYTLSLVQLSLGSPSRTSRGSFTPMKVSVWWLNVILNNINGSFTPKKNEFRDKICRFIIYTCKYYALSYISNFYNVVLWNYTSGFNTRLGVPGDYMQFFHACLKKGWKINYLLDIIFMFGYSLHTPVKV